jgi:type I restriction enzyme S subunit
MVMSDVPNGKAIAKCFYVDRDNCYTVNQRICALRPTQVDEKLLFYKLNRNPFYLAFDDGVKQTNLRKDDVLSCPLSIPKSAEEQRAIAAALSDVDALISALGQLIAKKRDLKQAAMQQLLTGKLRLLEFDGE